MLDPNPVPGLVQPWLLKELSPQAPMKGRLRDEASVYPAPVEKSSLVQSLPFGITHPNPFSFILCSSFLSLSLPLPPPPALGLPFRLFLNIPEDPVCPVAPWANLHQLWLFRYTQNTTSVTQGQKEPGSRQ